jgi:hypothetical protein
MSLFGDATVQEPPESLNAHTKTTPKRETKLFPLTPLLWVFCIGSSTLYACVLDVVPCCTSIFLRRCAMISHESQEIARQAEWLYEHRLKAFLEPTHTGEFVAIEPASGAYFVGATLSEAIGAARSAYPSRLAYAMRIGHRTAVHLGTSQHRLKLLRTPEPPPSSASDCYKATGSPLTMPHAH